MSILRTYFVVPPTRVKKLIKHLEVKQIETEKIDNIVQDHKVIKIDDKKIEVDTTKNNNNGVIDDLSFLENL